MTYRQGKVVRGFAWQETYVDTVVDFSFIDQVVPIASLSLLHFLAQLPNSEEKLCSNEAECVHFPRNWDLEKNVSNPNADRSVGRTVRSVSPPRENR